MNRWMVAAVLACMLASAQAEQEPGNGEMVAVDSALALATVTDIGAAAAVADALALAKANVGQVRSRLGTGIASWYGGRFHGRKTASGEAFDMDALTAAHPKLPFGSWVRVHNPTNGLSVDVRINDRGPFIKRRIIDLSRAAARALGVSGTHQVEISLLEKSR